MAVGRDSMGRFTGGGGPQLSATLYLNDHFSGPMNKAVGVVKGSADKMRMAFSTVKNSVFSLKGALIGLGVTQVGRSFVRTAADVENFRATLTSTLGSMAQGNMLFQDLEKYAAKVPFTLDEIVRTGTAMSGVLKGGRAEIAQLMPLVGDLAGVGKSMGISFEQTGQQLMRMWNSGAASADLFRDRGISAMMGFKTGVQYSVDETRQMILDSWTKTDSQFAGSAARLANTWDGKVSMMQDAWFRFKKSVMEAGPMDYLKAILVGTTENLNEMNKSAEATGKTVVGAMRSIFMAVAYVKDAVKVVEIAFLTLPAGVLKGVKAIVDIWDKLNDTIMNGLQWWGSLFGIDTGKGNAAKKTDTKSLEDRIKLMDGLIESIRNEGYSVEDARDKWDEFTKSIEKNKAALQADADAAKGAGEALKEMGATLDEVNRIARTAADVGPFGKLGSYGPMDAGTTVTGVRSGEAMRIAQKLDEKRLAEFSKEIEADLALSVDDWTAKHEKLAEGMDKTIDKWKEFRDISRETLKAIANSINNEILNAFDDWVNGELKKARDYLRSMVQDLGKLLLRKGLETAVSVGVNAIFGSSGGGMAGGGVLSAPTGAMSFRAFAGGGPTPHITTGPELWAIGEGNRGRQREAIIPLTGNRYVEARLKDPAGGRPIQNVTVQIQTLDSEGMDAWMYRNSDRLAAHVLSRYAENPNSLQRVVR